VPLLVTVITRLWGVPGSRLLNAGLTEVGVSDTKAMLEDWLTATESLK
jgi:hypothetical protein